MEYPVGTQFVIDGKKKMTIQVVEHKHCDGCYFIALCKGAGREFAGRSKYGECSCLERKDETNIIFKPIKENDLEY